MRLDHKFKKSFAKKWCMRFKASVPRWGKYDGIVRMITPEFIVLRTQDELELDGITILPRKVIQGTRDGRIERCLNQLLRGNASWKKTRIPKWLEGCGTIRELIAAFKRRGVWPLVGIAYGRGNTPVFYLGPITRLTEDGFFLRCYDGAGKWEKEYELAFEEIFEIVCDSRYCNHFNRYMRKRPFERKARRVRSRKRQTKKQL